MAKPLAKSSKIKVAARLIRTETACILKAFPVQWLKTTACLSAGGAVM